MYRVIKVLNNNGTLVYHVETGKEMILPSETVWDLERNLQNRSRTSGSQSIFPCHKKGSRSLF